MKGGSAPLRMAWELVSGLPVSTQSGQGRLMHRMKMKGQLGGRDGRKIKKSKSQVKITMWQGRVTVGTTITKFRIPFPVFACMTGGENLYRSEESCRRN